MEHLKKLIREVPDWPKKGILFYDITTLLKDPTGLHELIDGLAELQVTAKLDELDLRLLPNINIQNRHSAALTGAAA